MVHFVSRLICSISGAYLQNFQNFDLIPIKEEADNSQNMYI